MLPIKDKENVFPAAIPEPTVQEKRQTCTQLSAVQGGSATAVIKKVLEDARGLREQAPLCKGIWEEFRVELALER